MDEVSHFARAAARAPGPTCIDLFSGAGGMAEGFRQAGFAVLSGNDRDAAAGKTFRKNFPEASFYLGPIGSLTGAELLEDGGLEQGELDCLIGGPPCQSFSYNNHARSRRKARARLFRDYLRIVEALLPKCLVMENVPGILTVGGGAVVEEIYGALEELGYECEARILFSEDFGVPQTRRRVFFVATRLGWEDTLFPRGSCRPTPKPTAKVNPYVHQWQALPGEALPKAPSVWQAISDLPRLANGGAKPAGPHSRMAMSPFQREMRSGDATLLNHAAPKLGSAMLERIKHVPEGGNWRDIPFKKLPAGMQRAEAGDHTKRYGRLAKRGLCCTILTKCDPHWGSYIHPVDDRALSVREAARLQSFPDKFAFLGTKTEQFQQVGNAVPPLMAAAVGRSVLSHVQRNGGQAHAQAA